MCIILANILSLSQHLKTLNETPEVYCPDTCVYCQGTNINHHGVYYRRSDRLNPSKDSLNPIPIPRFLCVKGKHTFSTLPECIPPRRWYLWITQQSMLISCLMGVSTVKLASLNVMSRSTIKRWHHWLEDSFSRFWATLCSQVTEQGYYSDCAAFWLHWFNSQSLSQAMIWLNRSGVIVP